MVESRKAKVERKQAEPVMLVGTAVFLGKMAADCQWPSVVCVLGET
jgi:hypothetical protein